MVNKSDPSDRLQDAAVPAATPKKPYRKPALRRERVFETSALTCGKVQVIDQQCHANRKLS